MKEPVRNSVAADTCTGQIRLNYLQGPSNIYILWKKSVKYGQKHEGLDVRKEILFNLALRRNKIYPFSEKMLNTLCNIDFMPASHLKQAQYF